MTAGHDDMEADMELVQVLPDKLDAHHRQQLSAMLDGELGPDQARFLLRRLQHDRELAGRWERWQLCGDILRGRAEGLLPRDFAQQVMTAIERDGAAVANAAPGVRQRGLLRWSGGALAASVALVALLLGRQTTPPASTEAPVQLASSTVQARPVEPLVEASSTVPATVDPGTAAGATLLAGAVAVAEVPRRASARRGASSRAQSQRAALRTSIARDVPSVLVANASVPVQAPVVADPFIVQPDTGETRPWPRAVLPNLRADAGLAVDYAGGSSPSFYPFQPPVTAAAGQPPAVPQAAGAGSEP